MIEASYRQLSKIAGRELLTYREIAVGAFSESHASNGHSHSFDSMQLWVSILLLSRVKRGRLPFRPGRPEVQREYRVEVGM